MAVKLTTEGAPVSLPKRDEMYHTVKAGENLWRIAANHLREEGKSAKNKFIRAEVKRLIHINQIAPTKYLIRPGQRILFGQKTTAFSNPSIVNSKYDPLTATLVQNYQNPSPPKGPFGQKNIYPYMRTRPNGQTVRYRDPTFGEALWLAKQDTKVSVIFGERENVIRAAVEKKVGSHLTNEAWQSTRAKLLKVGQRYYVTEGRVNDFVANSSSQKMVIATTSIAHSGDSPAIFLDEEFINDHRDQQDSFTTNRVRGGGFNPHDLKMRERYQLWTIAHERLHADTDQWDADEISSETFTEQEVEALSGDLSNWAYQQEVAAAEEVVLPTERKKV